MKVCPTCQRTFDDSQNFCLNDGTPLAPAEVSTESETVVTNRPTVIGNARIIETPEPIAPPPQSQYVPPPPAPPRSRTGLIVALTALTTLLLIGVGAGGYWLLTRQRQTVQNNANANLSKPTPAKTNANSAVVTNVNKTNANSANANTNSTPANTAQPSPKPTIGAEQEKIIKQEAARVLASWSDALEANDLDAHLSHYADSVDYYNGSNFSRERIRADKQRAFQNFSTMTVDISNERVTIDPSGARATVVYDKEWYFEGPEKNSEGKVQSQLVLEKHGNRWLIVSERDLRTY